MIIPGLGPTEKALPQLLKLRFQATLENSLSEKAFRLKGMSLLLFLGDFWTFLQSRFLTAGHCMSICGPHCLLNCKLHEGRDLASIFFPAGGKPTIKLCQSTSLDLTPGYRALLLSGKKLKINLLSKVQSPSLAAIFLSGRLWKKQRFIYKEIKRFAFLTG